MRGPETPARVINCPGTRSFGPSHESVSIMIDVQRLSKRYGAVLAVDRVSFAIGKGEIVGLLGPNGAGKTTTMRILTTFLAPTSGQAKLAGHDVLDEPLEVRR